MHESMEQTDEQTETRKRNALPELGCERSPAWTLGVFPYWVLYWVLGYTGRVGMPGGSSRPRICPLGRAVAVAMATNQNKEAGVSAA